MNGKQGSVTSVDRERVPSEVLQTITLDDIATGIAHLVALVRAQIPEGKAPYMPVTVNTELREIPLQPPWFSVQVINDGDDTLEVHLNQAQRPPREVRAGEDVEFRFTTAVIKALLLRAQTGTLEVRIQGLY